MGSLHSDAPAMMHPQMVFTVPILSRFMDVELQQRAVEYMSLERQPELARNNVVAMPPWEKRKSLLLRRMAQREVRSTQPRKIQPLNLSPTNSLGWAIAFDGYGVFCACGTVCNPLFRGSFVSLLVLAQLCTCASRHTPLGSPVALDTFIAAGTEAGLAAGEAGTMHQAIWI